MSQLSKLHCIAITKLIIHLERFIEMYENSKEKFDVHLTLCTVKRFRFCEVKNEMKFFARLNS